MDLSLSPDQRDLQDLARRILGDACTSEHLTRVATTEHAVDLALWRSMAGAGLVGIALPEALGGGGLGFLETCVVLDAVARTAAPVPALATMALGAPTIAAHGSVELQRRLLPGVATGTTIVTGALTEAVGDPRLPATTADAHGRLHGEKICVPAGLIAGAIVASATGSDGPGLWLVDPAAAGVRVEREDTTSGVPEALLVLDGASAEPLGGGADALDEMIERATAAACVMVAASCEAALSLTAGYAKERTQFDRPIASFQAVSQRVADAYIDTEAVRLTAWQAAWRLSAGVPAAEQVAIAKFWAAEGGWRVLHAAHHVHGGVGVDRDYPLHRHFLASKQLELLLGGATPSLQRLGRLLATEPAG